MMIFPGFHPKWDAVTIPSKSTLVTLIICVASGANIFAKNKVRPMMIIIEIRLRKIFPFPVSTHIGAR